MIRALAAQSVIYAGTTIVQRGAQMVTLLVLPLFLTPTDYGAVQMIATVAILVNWVGFLEISQAMARYSGGGAPSEAHRTYSNTAWWFSVIMALLLLVIGFAGQYPLARLIFGAASYPDVYRLGVILMVTLPLFYFLQHQLRFDFDPKGYALVSIVFAAVTMAVSLGLATVVEPAVNGVMLGQVIGAACAVLVAVLRRRGLFRFTFDTAKFREMAAFSLPLVPAQLALFATLYASRLIVNDVATLHEVGLFTFASQIAAITSLATLGINAALAPLIMAHHEEPSTPPMLARLFEGFTAVAIMLCLLLGLFAPQLIVLIGNPDYFGAGSLVMILAPAAMLSQMYIFSPGFFLAKKTSHQMAVSIISAVIGIAANYLLVIRFGIFGAAVGSLIGAGVFLALWIALTQRLYRVPIRWGRVSLVAAVGVVLAFAGLGGAPVSGLVAESLYKLALIGAVGVIAVAAGLLPGPRMLVRLASTELTRLRGRGLEGSG